MNLQRGRRRSSPEGPTVDELTPDYLMAFNGAGDVHRRKGASRSFIATSPPPFNGAGDVHRRKGLARLDGHHGGWSPSTGPATFIAGRRRQHDRDPRGRDPSTGPATFIAGRIIQSGMQAEIEILQRGRRRSSPEGMH